MRRKTRSLSLKDCYEILNLPRDASIEDVKHAYRKRAFELHPDLHPNDPSASKKFQFLNEAYVALSAVLKAEEAKAQAKRERKAAKEQAKEQTKAKQQAESKAKTEAESQAKAQETENKRREQADQAYAEQDVLRDLLNDPFARRVFEDIYSELNRQQAEKGPSQPQAEPTKEAEPKKTEPPKPEYKPQEKVERPKPAPKPTPVYEPKDDKTSGVGGIFKNWFKRQIDEEQTLYLSPSQLVAGRKVLLQISHGLSNAVQQIEVTLPKDFQIGKPLRLRGLGKHVGPWKGDLYLILLKKT